MIMKRETLKSYVPTIFIARFTVGYIYKETSAVKALLHTVNSFESVKVSAAISHKSHWGGIMGSAVIEFGCDTFKDVFYDTF